MEGKKKALCVATVASNLDNFNRNNVALLLELGYEVTLAANFDAREDSSPKAKLDAFAEEMNSLGVEVKQVDFSRHPGKLGQQIRSIRQMRNLLKENHYDLIHCHTPIASVIVRALANRYRASRKASNKKINNSSNGTRVIYTAHGFHFFRGAPKKNWMIYYPLEKWASRFTDTLITINEEDFHLAKERFHAREVVRIPGVGVDTELFRRIIEDPAVRKRKREELGLSDKDVLMISVGELNENKNHELVVRSIAELTRKRPDLRNSLTYLICGKGENRADLEKLIDNLEVRDIVTILGFREDVIEFLVASDIFLFSSKREGLPLSLLEAMAAGLPAVVTNIRGNRDLVKDGENGFVTGFDEREFAERIETLARDRDMRRAMKRQTLKRVKRNDISAVREKMRRVYLENRENGFEERNHTN